MVQFYCSLLAEIPKVFRKSAEGVVFWAFTVGAPIATFLWPKLAPMDIGRELSHWWALLPIAVSVVYGMLRVNYERFEAIRTELATANEAEKARRQRTAIRSAVGNYRRSFINIQNACIQIITSAAATASPEDELVRTALKMADDLDAFVTQFFDVGEASLLLSDTGAYDPGDPDVEIQLQDFPNRLLIYRMATHKVKTLGRLLESGRAPFNQLV